jgi:alkanesulfonate monooxygenase SsuD/methylene tetrahydromethanopterin reductase-like flavin-dependent oxidoreductase (luciferase family)
MVNFGIYLSTYHTTGNIHDLIELAELAEEHGWDGYFLWDHILTGEGYDVIDPWVALSAIAVRTNKLTLGTTVTPLPRRRPWKVAREIASLAQLSNNRVVLGVGLGGGIEFSSFGEENDPRIRVEMLDESLDIIQGLLSGEKFSFQGKHYQIDEAQFTPATDISIWVGGQWPNKKPFKRASRYQGTFPISVEERLLSADEVRELMAYVRKQNLQLSDDFELILALYSFDEPEKNEYLKAYVEAGLSWYLEMLHPWRGDLDELKHIVKRGPPQL